MPSELSTYQHAALQAMGIQQWQLREHLTLPEAEATESRAPDIQDNAKQQRPNVLTDKASAVDNQTEAEPVSDEIPAQLGKALSDDIALSLDVLGLKDSMQWQLSDTDRLVRNDSVILVPRAMSVLTAVDKRQLWKLLCEQ